MEAKKWSVLYHLLIQFWVNTCLAKKGNFLFISHVNHVTTLKGAIHKVVWPMIAIFDPLPRVIAWSKNGLQTTPPSPWLSTQFVNDPKKINTLHGSYNYKLVF